MGWRGGFSDRAPAGPSSPALARTLAESLERAVWNSTSESLPWSRMVRSCSSMEPVVIGASSSAMYFRLTATMTSVSMTMAAMSPPIQARMVGRLVAAFWARIALGIWRHHCPPGGAGSRLQVGGVFAM